MDVTFIGDIHGDFDTYMGIARRYDRTIQVGDMGIGFGKDETDLRKFLASSQKHKFIRGNHDNPDVLFQNDYPGFIHDGFFKENILYIGGAMSIDAYIRTHGVDWWPNEEVNYSDMQKFIDRIEHQKPKVIVSHDGPETAVHSMFSYRVSTINTTRTGLQMIFREHKPDFWIFGHHHPETKIAKYIDGTMFICLPIEDTITISI